MPRSSPLACFDAIAPADLKTHAADLVLRYGNHATPFGQALFVATDRGLCALSFIDCEEDLEAVRRRWPGVRFVPDGAFTIPFATEMARRAEGRRPQAIPLLLTGTPFQVHVWAALLRIPEGSITTYSALAERVRARAAVRAVASAVAANHVAYLVPCHRVILASGSTGGYRWGEARKQAILAFERARRAG